MKIVSIFLLLVLISSCSSVNRESANHQRQLEMAGIVRHMAYTLSYNEKYEQPNWVEYSLKCSDLKKNIERTDDYRPDPFVKTGTLSPSDYKYSGY